MNDRENRLDVIWAPWRMAYIGGTDRPKEEPAPQVLPGGEPKCFICQGAVCAPETEKDRYILEQTPLTIILFNRYPYDNGHLLVAPRRHVARLDLLTPEERAELIETVSRWITRLERVMNAEGFNVGLNLGKVAGAGLPGHLHWHIIPRWNGDTNFTTTCGSLKVIPQSMDALWDLLKEEIAKEGK